jgi:RNAse (barnase) inhibitor barstar
MNNLFITDTPEELADYSIIAIDGKLCKTLNQAYETLAEKLYFPEYFEANMDSLDEVMNDLSWIEDERILIFFKNSSEFLINERNEKNVKALLELLDITCEDWKFMDVEAEEEALITNAQENQEDYFIPKKELLIGFSRSRRMEELIAEFN